MIFATKGTKKLVCDFVPFVATPSAVAESLKFSD